MFGAALYQNVLILDLWCLGAFDKSKNNSHQKMSISNWTPCTHLCEPLRHARETF